MNVVSPTWLSVQFSHSFVSSSLRPHELQHNRPPCPSPTPGVYQNSCPLSWWCHPTISSSVIPFSPCLQSSPASGSFPVSHFFASGGRSIGSFSFSISHSNEYSGLISFRIDWFDFLGVQGASQESSPIPQFKGISSSNQVAKVIGVSALASVIPMNIQDWFPLEWTGLISLLSKGLSRVFSTPQFKGINSSMLSLFYGST